MFTKFIRPLHIAITDAATNRGFGLVELLVSVGIMTLLTIVIFADYTSFNSSVLLRNQAFEVGLSLRETQTTALTTVGVGGDYRQAYGVYFNVNTPNQYIIFADANNNYEYDSGEAIRAEPVDSRFEIRDLQVVGTTGGTIDGTELAVMFERPNFDATYRLDDLLYDSPSARIGISRMGQTGTGPDVYRTVIVTGAGQIEVE